MKKKFIKDISANSIQVIINQVCGLLIFYILSAFLDKNEFGEINWTLAVLLTSFSILSFGMDQVVIKKIASGNDASYLFSLYAMHVLFTGFLFYGLLLLSHFIFNNFFLQHQLLLLLGIGKLMLFFSTPFKQVATGLEKFRPLVFMSVCSNIIRSIALVTIAVFHRFDLAHVVIIFILGDIAELLLSYFTAKYLIKIPLWIRWDKEGYLHIIKESLPQAGVVIFTSAIARFDWVLLGILTSNIVLAEYSFAYKVFEMATLPLLVIAPILIPRFTKLFDHQPADDHPVKINDLLVLLRVELIVASIAAMVLTICWVPLVDWITQGKYGAVNHCTIFILAASMPFLYLNNFLWTINFTKGNLQIIFHIILVTFMINMVADIIFIPFLKGEGAAIANLIAIVVQSFLFLQKTNMEGIPKKGYSWLLIPALAMLSGISSTMIFQYWWLVLPSSFFFFGGLLFFTGQIRNNDWLVFKRVTGI